MLSKWIPARYHDVEVVELADPLKVHKATLAAAVAPFLTSAAVSLEALAVRRSMVMVAPTDASHTSSTAVAMNAVVDSPLPSVIPEPPSRVPVPPLVIPEPPSPPMVVNLLPDADALSWGSVQLPGVAAGGMASLGALRPLPPSDNGLNFSFPSLSRTSSCHPIAAASVRRQVGGFEQSPAVIAYVEAQTTHHLIPPGQWVK